MTAPTAPKAPMLAIASLVACLMLGTGCRESRTDFTYGKAAGASVNGISVFANLLRERGHNVSRKSRLTERFQNFDTIVWAPDNLEHPPENVVAWLEDWLIRSSGRTIIFIGRGYDAKLPYYQARFANSDPENRDAWQRELAEQIVYRREYDFTWNTNATTETEAFWYEPGNKLPQGTGKLGGFWSRRIDANAVELDCSHLLKPIGNYNDEDSIPRLDEVASEADDYEYTYVLSDWVDNFREGDVTAKELLTVDGLPFAFEFSSASNPQGKVIIISNGSFLLNFPLMNAEHRKLAAKVADEVTGDVVILESGFQWPRIGGSANDPALRWTWIGKAPMSYIVPHFLFWGVLYCFAFFPNFGRPKRIQFHPPKAFRSHVQAVASILGRSKERNWARQIVDAWLRRSNKSKD